MLNENLLVEKALKQPVFGWGGWGRACVYDESGRDITITDGMWVIALGNNGLIGLISFNASLLLPIVLLVKRFPARALVTGLLAPASVLAILLNLYSIDCIANAMVNPIYFLVLGGLTGILGPSGRHKQPLTLGSKHVSIRQRQRQMAILQLLTWRYRMNRDAPGAWNVRRPQSGWSRWVVRWLQLGGHVRPRRPGTPPRNIGADLSMTVLIIPSIGNAGSMA